MILDNRGKDAFGACLTAENVLIGICEKIKYNELLEKR